jgi:hypothetical protein
VGPVHKENAAGNVAALFLEKRSLEYLHRNIFLGTTSLNTFLENLPMTFTCSCPLRNKATRGINDTCPCPIMTTKKDITSTFSALAKKEQEFMRSKSQNREGWDLLREIDLACENNSVVSLARIQLGSIMLGEFLDYVGPEGREGTVSVKAVAKAFEKACRTDRKREWDSSSKAAAYRRSLNAQERDVD